MKKPLNKQLNYYLIYQGVNNGYDTYDSAVVVADSEEAAKSILPNCSQEEDKESPYKRRYGWAPVVDVVVEYLGPVENTIYSLGDTVLASFNAG